MKILFYMCIFFFVSANCFGQSSELSASLKTLKKNLQEHSISSPSSVDNTRFKAKKFESCAVSYYYLINGANPETMVDFKPILSSTGTFNRNDDNSKNQVYIKDKANDGTVTRNEGLSRNNEVKQTPQANTDPIKSSQLNFEFVIEDSIVLANEKDKNRYSLTFLTKEVTLDYKIEEKKTIYLKAKSQEIVNEIVNNFKQVVSLCQAK
jgi:hypothetical protein